MKRPIILLAAGALLVACRETTTLDPPITRAPNLSTAGIAVGTETRIATGESPKISGDRVVYFNLSTGSWDIFMYDLARHTETRITADPAHYYKWYPNISGDRATYQILTGPNWEDWDIFMYDLATQTQTRITTARGYSVGAVISGDRIVWADDRNEIPFNGNWDIYMYDLATHSETQITTDPGFQNAPAISGDRIVWVDGRNANPLDIYMYDLGTHAETRITTAQGLKRNPAISGDRIVWTDRRNGNADIYMYDLATHTETQITTDPADQVYPAISGDRIVWGDNRNGPANTDVYMYDLATGTETQITTDPSPQVLPAIYGDRIVWNDYRNGASDIYLYELSAILPACHQSLRALLDQYIADGSIRNHGIGEALGAFLRQLGAACARGDTVAAQRILEHFISFVEGQSGKGIAADAARTLASAAEAVISNGCCCS